MAKMSRSEAERILGLSGTYTKQELRTIYRKLSMSYHPDHAASSGMDNDSATVKMQDINEAYQRIMRSFNSNGTDTLTAETGSHEEEREDAEEESRAAEEARRAAEEAKRAAEEAKRAAEEEEARRKEEKARRDYNAYKPFFDYRSPEEQARTRMKWRKEVEERLRNDPDSSFYRPPEEEPEKEEEPVETVAAETGKVPGWLRAVKVIATIFPYRIALLVGITYAMNAIVGIDFLGGPMGLAPNPDADALLILLFPLLFFASIGNLIYPFMTGPIRRGILEAVKKAEENAKRRTA